ncbi:YdcF family protein [Sporosalibacterium faouarense]|uniref:YdcF family protein n=1 Tax=Sporosalibacterium faouarense TaxID=516123 RepID=UPI00192BC5B0|nr:YdcF family protein [Sporosalibacterium faouarense]
MKAKFRKQKKRLIIIAMVIIISYVTYISFDIYQYGNIDEAMKADAAIVLGAATWGSKPSPVFEERIKHGIWLYENGYVNKLIFTGAKGEGSNFSEAEVAKNYAIDESVPNEDIFIEEKSTITQENLFYASKIVKNNDFSRVIIVSDPLHMKRAMLMAIDYGLNAHSSPTPTTKIKSIKNKLSFLGREVILLIGYKVYRLL